MPGFPTGGRRSKGVLTIGYEFLTLIFSLRFYEKCTDTDWGFIFNDGIWSARMGGTEFGQ
jgi:hypothetical protein